MIFICFRFPVFLCGSPGISNCQRYTLCLLSPRLGFFIVLNRDLFFYRDDSLTRLPCCEPNFEPFQKLRAMLDPQNRFKPQVNNY